MREKSADITDGRELAATFTLLHTYVIFVANSRPRHKVSSFDVRQGIKCCCHQFRILRHVPLFSGKSKICHHGRTFFTITDGHHRRTWTDRNLKIHKKYNYPLFHCKTILKCHLWGNNMDSLDNISKFFKKWDKNSFFYQIQANLIQNQDFYQKLCFCGK